MNKRSYSLPLILMLLFLLSSGCVTEKEYDLILDFNFKYINQDWEGGFADYPVDTTGWPGFDLTWSHEPLPANLGDGKGLYISGDNHSNDLFMYIKYNLTGLLVYATYRARFEIRVATDAPSGCSGTGEPPGESVYLKAGVTTTEPDTIVEDGYYVMNIDKGNQKAGGEDAIVLGHIGNSNTDCLNPVYEIKSFDSDPQTFEFTTGGAGSVWLLVGTDSGFEGRTSLYYTNVRVSLAQEP